MRLENLGYDIFIPQGEPTEVRTSESRGYALAFNVRTQQPAIVTGDVIVKLNEGAEWTEDLITLHSYTIKATFPHLDTLVLSANDAANVAAELARKAKVNSVIIEMVEQRFVPH
ncbi:MAG: hypothetical protein GKR90_26640 [Pseudomonadales bacterium]|nr:hypothetical protein [Pseudomonadales bacterium]